jgi:anaerobic selenocysteine-containing dehydrogenase
MPENMILMADSGKNTPPFLIKQLSDDVLLNDELFVQLNPVTAMYRNIADGDRVELESPRGKLTVRARVFDGIREGVVLLPLGFGHTAYDEFLRGKGVNAHKILKTERDAVIGLPVRKPTPGRLTKV